MCIDDQKRRRPLVLQLTQPQQALQISMPETMGLLTIELAGYQFDGVAVAAGVPYTGAFYLAVNGGLMYSEMLATNNGTPLAGVSGIPLQLNGAFTSQQYDTPRVIARRLGMPMLAGTTNCTVSLYDDVGQPAAFTKGVIYCNMVFDTCGFADIGKSVTRNHTMTFAEHVLGGIGR